MLGHYLLTLYRSLSRHRLYAALNVLGLAVGIAVFLTLWLDVRFETSFERWIPDASQVYVVAARYIGALSDLGPTDSSMGGLLEELKADYPQLVGVRLDEDRITVRQAGRPTAERISETDPGFFDVFDLPLLYGDRATALARPDALVLTRSKAIQYFGAPDALGRALTLVVNGKPEVHRVAGVLADPPRSSDLNLAMLIPLTPHIVEAASIYWRHWGSFSVTTFLRLRTPAEAAALDAQLDSFTDRHGVKDMGRNPSRLLQLRTRPLLWLHLEKPRDRTVVAGLFLVGVLTLLLAAVNYVNLATARADLRAREVAMRKVLGATGTALVGQFMAEALASAAVAALVGLALCELAVPLINAAGGAALTVPYLGWDGVIAVLAAVILAVGILAGVYPALVLSRFRPAAILASARAPGGGRAGSRVRAALVVVQFAIAIAFTVSTGVILAQTRYLRTADLGFRRDGLISVASFGDSEVTAAQRRNLLSAWKALPGVASVTASDIAPADESAVNTNNTRQPWQPPPGPDVHWEVTRPDFFPTYGARLIAGRVLDPAYGQDVGPAAHPTAYRRNVVLNARALSVLGFRSPQAALGRPLRSGGGDLAVVGVVGDIRLRSPHDPVPPTIYLLSQDDFDNQVAAVRYSGVDPAAVLGAMRRTWRELAPDAPFRAATAQDSLQRYYRPSDQNARLFVVGAALAVGIGCVGLYGLAAFTTTRRVKEIGIRKALGASTRDVLALLVGQFLRPVLLANLIAWPLAWVAMRGWLSGFDQRIGLNPAYFLAATLLSLAIAVATVAGQALAVARAEPARALRYE